MPWRAPVPRIVTAARTLDLDDFGAEVGEQLRAPGTGQDAAEVEYLDAFEGPQCRFQRLSERIARAAF